MNYGYSRLVGGSRAPDQRHDRCQRIRVRPSLVAHEGVTTAAARPVWDFEANWEFAP